MVGKIESKVRASRCKRIAAKALLFVMLVFASLPVFCLEVESAELSNGIPVYVARESSRMFAIRIVVKGGAAYLDEDTSGLESALFSWMTYGSKKYGKEAIDRFSYDKSFAVSSAASQDDASLFVTCIDKYTKTALDVLCDMFINPAFSEKEMLLLLDGIKSNLAMKKEDPESMLTDTISRVLYADHPYRVKSFVTDRSLPSITRDNILSLHKKDMDSRRIFVVASGNITAKALASKLNRTIGKIPALDTPIIERNIPPLSPVGGNVTITSNALDGTGYMQWVASGPAVTDEDAPAALVASQMYSRELFNVVREARGACYSAQSLCSVGRIGMTGVYLHSVSDLEHAASYEMEARKLLMQGRLASSNEAGGMTYESTASAIEGVKNAFLNSYYEGSTSRSAVCRRIAYSISIMGDASAYDKLLQKISTVTDAEALAAFNKYWTHGRWFAVVGTGDENKIRY